MVKGKEKEKEKEHKVIGLHSFCNGKNMICCSFCREIRHLNRHVFSIVGAHGVGKSYLVSRLCNMFDNASALNEVVRDVPFPKEINGKQSLRATEWIHEEHIRRLIEIILANRKAKEHIIICDRSEYDPYLYYLNKNDFPGVVNEFKDIVSDEFDNKPYKHHIILLDDNIHENAKNDDFRANDIRFFNEKRIMFYHFFTKCFDDILIVSRETDIREIVDWINNKVKM